MLSYYIKHFKFLNIPEYLWISVTYMNIHGYKCGCIRENTTYPHSTSIAPPSCDFFRYVNINN